MIPINLSIIGAGPKSDRAGRGFLLGRVVRRAMALVYGVLGVSRHPDRRSFGTINASPWFNLAIAVLFVFLAPRRCSTSSPIDFSSSAATAQVGDRQRAPFCWHFTWADCRRCSRRLRGAVGHSGGAFSSDLYAKGTAAALALPFVLGLGMALPWPLAGAGMAVAAETGHVDGARQAAFRRADSGDGGLLRLRSLRLVRQSVGGRRRSAVERPGEQLKAGWHASLDPALAVAKRDRHACAH
jgi:hypothetical protein